MGRKCSAPGCRSGYDGPKQGISIHTFPSNPEILQKWLRAIPRGGDWKPGNNSGLCSLHFVDSDYINEKQDSNLQRASRLTPLKLRLLKKDAIPTKFPNVPQYLSADKSELRSEASTSSERHKSVYDRAEAAAEAFLQQDEISSLDELRLRLDRSCLPSGVVEIHQNNELYFIGFSKDLTKGPQVQYSLIIAETLEFTMFSSTVQVPRSNLTHHCSRNIRSLFASTEHLVISQDIRRVRSKSLRRFISLRFSYRIGHVRREWQFREKAHVHQRATSIGIKISVSMALFFINVVHCCNVGQCVADFVPPNGVR